MPKLTISVILLLMICTKVSAQNNNIDSLIEKGWFISYCETPESSNIDSVNNLIEFPGELEGLEINRKVIFRALIDTTGEILDHKIINSTHPLLMRSAESKIHLVKFVPGDCFKGYLNKFKFENVWINFVLTAK